MSEFDPTLNEIVRIQQSFDIENFSGAETLDGKRTHVVLHLGKLMGKYAGIEEQADHGVVDESLLVSDLAPDLLVYAAQLTEYTGGNLHQQYTQYTWGRLPSFDSSRNGIAYLAEEQKHLDNKLYQAKGLESHDRQRRGVYLDLHQPISQLATLEKKRTLQFDDMDTIKVDITPRLVAAAIEIANLCNVSLATVYKERLEFVAERNGTGIESAHRALGIIASKPSSIELTSIQQAQLRQLVSGISDPIEVERISSTFKRRMARKNRILASRIR